MAKFEVEAIAQAVAKAVVIAMHELQPNEKDEILLEGYVPEESVKTYKQRNDFPEFLTPKEVSALARISLPKVYELFRSKDFPVNIWGKTKRVDKTDLLEYLMKHRGIDLTNIQDGDDE